MEEKKINRKNDPVYFWQERNARRIPRPYEHLLREAPILLKRRSGGYMVGYPITDAYPVIK